MLNRLVQLTGLKSAQWPRNCAVSKYTPVSTLSLTPLSRLKRPLTCFPSSTLLQKQNMRSTVAFAIFLTVAAATDGQSVIYLALG